jgi:hypothetical protein
MKIKNKMAAIFLLTHGGNKMKKNKSGVKFGNQSADWSKALQKIWIAWF